MSYFSMFPVLSYDAKGNGKETIMTNLFSRSVKSNANDNIVDFDYYDTDGETPEMIAYKYYMMQSHWVI